MKKIEAIIRPWAFNAVQAALTRRGVDGLCVSEVAGIGHEPRVASYRGVSFPVDLVPRLRIEVVTTDVQAGPIAVTIAEAARSVRSGDGVVYVTVVVDAVRIRTGERGTRAISDDIGPIDTTVVGRAAEPDPARLAAVGR